jgi:hypothetical protein
MGRWSTIQRDLQRLRLYPIGLWSMPLYLGRGVWTAKTVGFSGMAAPGGYSAPMLHGIMGRDTLRLTETRMPWGGSVSGLIGSGAEQVPAGFTITSATLKIFCTNNGANLVKLYRLTDDWVENQATWDQRTTGVAWTGGAGAVAAFEGEALDGNCSATGWRTIDVTRIVQNGAMRNELWIRVLIPNRWPAFDSSESANPPVLTVCEPTLQAIQTQSLSNQCNGGLSPWR